MAKLTREQRDKLPADEFAWPERRLYPVTDQDDLQTVAASFDKAPAAERDKIKTTAASIARRKGLTVPDTLVGAAFSAEFATAPTGTAANRTVTRKADLIFQAGDYDFPADKGGPFSMTPEDIMAACADFREPVELEDTHAPSVFNGKIGHLVSVAPSADFNQFGGEIKIPEWFDNLFKGEPIKLSARWDRGTKRLAKLAVVPNPRITDAAMFAAFAEVEVAAKTTKPEHFSPHGRKLLQFVHDHTAMHGACCKPEASPGVTSPSPHANFDEAKRALAAAGTADFMADHESETIQKLHDLTLGSGAACALYKAPKGKTGEWRPGQYYQSLNEMPAYKDYQPGRYAMLSADQGAQGVVSSGNVSGNGINTPSPEAQRLTAEFAAEKALMQARLDEANQQRKADRRAKYLAEGATFARTLRLDSRILAYQEPGVAAAFAQAAMDDEAAPVTVTFSDAAGRQQSGTRLQQLMAHYGEMPKNVLKEEKIKDGAQVVFNRTDTLTDREREIVEAQRNAEKYAEERNKLNGHNGASRQPAAR